MPLSEDEQRILRQIEEQLQRDPRFGRQARHAAGAEHGSPVPSLFGCVVAVVVCVLLLGVSPYLSFLAFVIAAVALASAWRRLSSSAQHVWSEGIRSRFPGR